MALSSTIQVISKSIFQSLQFLTVSPDTFQKQIFIFSSQPLNPTPLLTGCVFTASSLKIKVQIFSSKLNDSHQIARLCKGSFQVIQNDALELQIHDVFTGQARSNFDVSGQQFCCEKCQKKSVLGIFCSTCASQFCKVCGVVQCGKCGVVWE
ncbi:hypothetical protein SS50377_23593 [Spironucleus salmonicida]|nr:hypothetical protein SS50377_23593 [Spironucleus salmonicida]